MLAVGAGFCHTPQARSPWASSTHLVRALPGAIVGC
jgi:hypothetical protein